MLWRVGRQIVQKFEPVTARQIRLSVLASDGSFSISGVSVDYVQTARLPSHSDQCVGRNRSYLCCGPYF